MTADERRAAAAIWTACTLQEMVERGWLLPAVINPDFAPVEAWSKIYDLQTRSGQLPTHEEMRVALGDIGYTPFQTKHLWVLLVGVAVDGWDVMEADRNRLIGDKAQN